jgi:uncharacterized protein
MQQRITLKLLPSEVTIPSIVQQYAARTVGVPVKAITGYQVIKQSIDARGRQPWIMLTILVFVNEPFHERTIKKISLPDVSKANHKVIIVGAGPAGLFAALKLIEQGIKPVILERGKDVRSRRRDLAVLNKQGVVNSESNYCFGEGGAGTYSDGKLYTRSTKRGDVERILNILVQFGAHERILYEAHPHIGTNKLPEIITAIREQIVACGGEFLFEQKVTDLLIQNDSIHAVKTASGNIFNADAVILATGHSARDIFELLHDKNILIEAKPFALGVRVEHPQSIIDSIQYHCPAGQDRNEFLPPASYSLVQQVHERGVFSFCMCPGGIIAPASTNEGELVVNGWSPSKRNNPYANSGIVSAVELTDIMNFQKKNAALSHIKVNSPLIGMYFQQFVEQRSFQYGGGKMVAPAQRMADFTQKIQSSSLPDCSYLPGIASAPLNEVLPPFIFSSLQQAFIEFGKKMKGYFTNDAVLVATESRTSSPVRIPRDNETTQHPQIKRLYPCGEGAGYAGGIVSAAMDGERVSENIIGMLRV